ncbi:OmpA family protein [Patescibacteria group bacterium]|nr:OmpA family protein [Patescibacteria group bacterium]
MKRHQVLIMVVALCATLLALFPAPLNAGDLEVTLQGDSLVVIMNNAPRRDLAQLLKIYYEVGFPPVGSTLDSLSLIDGQLLLNSLISTIGQWRQVPDTVVFPSTAGMEKILLAMRSPLPTKPEPTPPAASSTPTTTKADKEKPTPRPTGDLFPYDLRRFLDNLNRDSLGRILPFTPSPSQLAPDSEIAKIIPLLDSDGDGVPLHNDLCPNTPPGCVVDEFGCPHDTDHDRICNELDNCPDISNAYQEDMDNDGLGDVCDPDIDGDGYANEDDYCPYDPPPNQGYAVDKKGCPKGFRRPTQMNLALRGLNFPTGSYELTSAAQESLKVVAWELNGFPSLHVEVHGHAHRLEGMYIGDTHEQGEFRTDSLSYLRAQAVADYLAEQGVDRKRLHVIWHSANDPIGDNGTPQGRRQNRRVELKTVQR